MKKSTIFQAVLDISSEVCGVRASSILGHLRDQAVVDARAIAVHAITRLGFSSKDIALNAKRINNPEVQFPTASQLSSSARRINYLRNLYFSRYETSNTFKILADSVNKKVDSYCEKLQINEK